MLSLQNASKMTQGLILFIGSIAVTFVLLEGIASAYYAVADDFRRWLRAVDGPGAISRELAYEANPKDRRPKIPKVEYNTYTGYLPVAGDQGPGYRVNAQGFRYDADLGKKEDREVRVFVTVGSFAWGAGVAQEYSYGAVAERILSTKFPALKVRVIVAGVGAFGSTQERILVENVVFRHEPDIVVQLSGWNDVYFGYQGKDILIDQDYFNYRKKIDPEFKKATVRAGPPIPNDYFFKTIYLYDRFLYKHVSSADEKFEEEFIAKQLPPENVVTTFLHNTLILNDLAKRRGWRHIVALQPSLYLTQKPLGPFEKSLLSSYRERFLNIESYWQQTYRALHASLRRSDEGHGFGFLDTDEAISGESKDVFFDHVHLGDRGNRLVGEYLAESLAPVIGATRARRPEPDGAPATPGEQPK